MSKGKGTKDYCTNDREDRAQPPDPDGDRGKLQERGPTRSDEGSNGVAQHETIGLGAKSNPGTSPRGPWFFDNGTTWFVWVGWALYSPPKAGSRRPRGPESLVRRGRERPEKTVTIARNRAGFLYSSIRFAFARGSRLAESRRHNQESASLADTHGVVGRFEAPPLQLREVCFTPLSVRK